MYGQPGYGQPLGYGQPPGYGQAAYGQAQGYGQPIYQQPPLNQGPTIIHIKNDNNSDGTPCQYCGTNTNNLTQRKVGCVGCLWGFCLLPVLLCWVPCCVEGCKDVELICVKCQNVKNTITANCC